VNLAAPVNDGEQLAVPQQGEALPTPVTAGAGRATRGPTPTPQGNWLLNVNSAAAGDFRALPGIGKVTADRLVAYRSQNGPYASVDDLLKAGMHKTELDRIRARLTVQ
jgi:competence protein ComEA